jgi:arylsulfatase
MRPNILFLFPDQWRADWIYETAELPLETPNLDKLRERGITFANVWSPSPVCAPARAALAAGRLYDRCEVVDNGDPASLDLPMFYHHLRDNGYNVCGVGKFDLDKPGYNWKLDGSSNLEAWGFTHGIDNEGKMDATNQYRKYNAPRGPYIKALDDAGYAEEYADEHLTRMEQKDAYISCVPEELYCDNWLSDNGINILKDLPKSQPWFMQVNFTGPHNPMDVTQRMHDDWDGTEFPLPYMNCDDSYTYDDHQRNRQHYAAMIENIDRQIGRFIDEIEKRGEQENTLIVFSSDHGEMLGDFNKWGKSVPYFGSLNVPLIISGIGVQAGVVSEALVNGIDLSATFLSVSESKPLADSDANDLSDIIFGKSTVNREYITSGLRDWRAVTDGEWKLVVYNDGRRELYKYDGIDKDLENLIGEHPEIAEKLMELLKKEVPL